MGDRLNQMLQSNVVAAENTSESRPSRKSGELEITKKSLLPVFTLKTLEDLNKFNKSLVSKRGPKIESEFVHV